MNIILIIILITILMILIWAVLSSRTGTVAEIKPQPAKEQTDEPEKILRRRSADREIEKEYPAEKISPDTMTESQFEKEDSSGQIQLPFPANDIIADGSRFKLYKRALINSEIYAKRGDIETAVSLFKGVKERILDSDIRSKIESNINYLNHFRHRREEDFKKRMDSVSTALQQPSGELRLRIDGPVPQTINIGIPDKSAINTDEIVEKLSGQIAKELGTLKNDIERLKTKPEEKFDLDDYARFSAFQHEFNKLKERFEELTEERIRANEELKQLREMKLSVTENEHLNREYRPENHEILNDIRKEIDNLSGLKHSLDSLHNKIEEITAFRIPESEHKPSIVQAKYESPIPVQFDTKPVLEILEKINQYRREEKAELPPDHEKPAEHITEQVQEEHPAYHEIHEEIIEKESEEPARQIPEPDSKESAETSGEITPDEPEEEKAIPEAEPDAYAAENEEVHTITEIIHGTDSAPDVKAAEPDDELFPETEFHEKIHSEIILHEKPEHPASGSAVFHLPEDISLDDLTTLEAEEFINEPSEESEKEPAPEEPLFQEPETRYEEEIPEKKHSPREDKTAVKEKDEDLTAELSDEEIQKFSGIVEPAQEYPVKAEEQGKKDTEDMSGKIPSSEDFIKTGKEKEIEKHREAEEDPNDFELLSDIGKVKDESTLTDEDIFEKILKDDRTRRDDSAFEIIGDNHRDDQEFSLNDSILDGKMKAEQDFYKKFIKADRIKKRELPILRVSYDFKKLPDEFSLSREKNILEYSFYKYKPMLEKADEFIKHRHVRDAINYYKVVLDQNIPIEFKAMIKRNIRDLTEYLEKYLSTE